MANVEMKCPCCGGSLEYDNTKDKVVCPFCDTEFSNNDLKEYAADIESDGQEDASWSQEDIQNYTDKDAEGIKIYTCNSCGGEIVTEETTSSTECPFCGNNVLVSKELSGDLKPNYIIIFNKDKEQAIQALKGHFRKKLLLPRSFSQTSTIEEIKSLYVPFWVFDADVNGKVRYRGEKTRRWSDANYNYTETRYYNIIRGGHLAFDKVPVDGSKKMQDELMESIEPFDFKEAKPFEPGYLSGWAADRYDVDQDVTFKRATERFRNGTVEIFRDDIHGYKNVHVQDSTLNLSDTSSKYALYPVWVLNTKWNDKDFHFAMNGQTGKIAGNLPISKIKFAFFSFLFFALPLILGIVLAFLTADKDAGETVNGAMIGVGIVLGLIVSIATMTALYKKNKNVRFQYGARPYVRPNSLNITTRREIFLYSKVSKTRKSSSNNSSSKKK